MKVPKAPKILKAARPAILFFIVGLCVGVIGVLFVQNHNPKDEPTIDNVSVVFERVVQQNELVCASQDYTFVEKASDTNKLFDLIEIPFSENHFWYRYSGRLKAAVNLEEAEYTRAGKTVTITLPPPYISSNTPDMDVSGVLEESNNLLNPIHVEDVDAFQRDCIAKSEEQAYNGTLFSEARANAADNVGRMFSAALGDEYVIRIEWSDGFTLQDEDE